MDWITITVVIVIVGAFLLLKRSGQVSEEAAREYLRRGAEVIDVRSPAEFRSEHLPKAINIPLGELQERIGTHASKKDEVLLLHCLSGARSGSGRRLLKQMGYTQVFNLGSYARAKRIVGSVGG